MSFVRLFGAPLRGEVAAPPSKSASHRALICAALAGGVSELSPFHESADMKATIGALRALGADIAVKNGAAAVDGRGIFSQKEKTADINCIESGSTLRFMIPVAAALGVPARFTGRGRLPQRPLDLFYEVLPAHGVTVSARALPLEVGGALRPGTFELPGNVSSQYISGLLMALPLLPGGSEIRLTTALESADYIEMTLGVMRGFGVTAHKSPAGWRIPGAQRYRPVPRYKTEGDWSQAAFFLCAGALAGDVAVTGLDPRSKQGDRRIVELLRRFGAHAEYTRAGARAKKSALSGVGIDAAQIPDLVPALAALAALAKGQTRIHSAARVRTKESDRLAASAKALEALGIGTAQDADSLTVYGGRPLGGRVGGASDHRIVMAFAALGSAVPGIVIEGPEAVEKSYPAFFDDYRALGGRAEFSE